MDNLELYGVLIIPLVTGMVELAKFIGIPDKMAPIVSIVLGLGIGIVGFSNGDVLRGVVLGTVIGLSASGFYSYAKIPFEEGE